MTDKCEEQYCISSIKVGKVEAKNSEKEVEKYNNRSQNVEKWFQKV